MAKVDVGVGWGHDGSHCCAVDLLVVVVVEGEDVVVEYEIEECGEGRAVA